MSYGLYRINIPKFCLELWMYYLTSHNAQSHFKMINNFGRQCIVEISITLPEEKKNYFLWKETRTNRTARIVPRYCLTCYLPLKSETELTWWNDLSRLDVALSDRNVQSSSAKTRQVADQSDDSLPYRDDVMTTHIFI